MTGAIGSGQLELAWPDTAPAPGAGTDHAPPSFVEAVEATVRAAASAVQAAMPTSVPPRRRGAARDGQDRIRRALQANTGRYRFRQIFEDWIALSVCAVLNGCSPRDEAWEARERDYLATVQRYTTEEAGRFAEALAGLIEALDAEPVDILGRLFMAGEMGAAEWGQFFTPYELCVAMAQMLFDAGHVAAAIEEKGYLTVDEPACGAGAMLIAAAGVVRDLGFNPQRVLRVRATDLDRTAAGMCYLQLSLLGIPAIVRHGNTLSNDTMAVWETPMAALAGWWVPDPVAA